ncbi:MAG: trypsin-like peptidase domain-containing protein [Mariniblastus sp.]
MISVSLSLAIQDIEQLEENAVRGAVESAASAVIRFDTIGGTNRVEGAVVGNGPATGTVVSEDGYVVSASFHFAHQPTTILARLPDGSRASAEIVGRDLTRKIVLLKLSVDDKQNSQKLPTIPVINKSDVQVGETVIAVGRTFDGSEPNVSTGIISAKNRVWDKAIQTDAKISPANFGGPLLNLKGQLIGILVPMSPDDDSEMAGTQWYDSGIGFAVPMSDILTRLDAMKSGTLRRGLAGISLAGTDTYADAAIVAICRATSPAGKIGIQAGDKIVEVNGRRIKRQSEMKHALGPLYEGDDVSIVVERPAPGSDIGESNASAPDSKESNNEPDNTTRQRLKFDIVLVGEIPPFVPAAVGLLASVNTENQIEIQHVFKNSPAAIAEIEKGWIIEKINDATVTSIEQVRLAIAGTEVGNELKLEFVVPTSNATISKTIETKKLTATFPDLDSATPTAFHSTAPGASKIVKVSSAEFANNCIAVVPQTQPNVPAPGLLVWLPAPGKLDRKRIEETWRSQCELFNVALLVPESTDEKKWHPRDFAFIASAIDTLAQKVNFDSSKVVIGGHKTGAAAASGIAFQKRDLFRGLVMIDSGLSRLAGTPTTSPTEPMMVLIGTNGKQDEKAASDAQSLERAHFPIQVEQKAVGTKLTSWVKDILAWVNATDRL